MRRRVRVAAGVAPEGSGATDIPLRLSVPRVVPVHAPRPRAAPGRAVRTGAGRRLRRTWLRRSTRARATTAAPVCSTAAGSARTPPDPTRTARSTRPSRCSASPVPRPTAARSSTSCSSGCSASCSSSGPSSRPRRRTGRSSSPGSSLTTEAMVTALEPLIDDITARYDAPTEFVLPGENRVAAALDVARTIVRRAERVRGRGGRRRLAARQPGRAVPQPARRPRLYAGPLAGGRVPPRPGRSRHLTPPFDRSRSRPLRSSPCPSRSPSSPRPPTASRPSCSPSPWRRVRRSVPVPTRSTPRSAAVSPRSWRKRASRASWARRSRCRPRGSCGPRPPSSWASAIPPSSPSTACAARRPRSPGARARSRRSRRRCATAGSALDVADAAQAVAEGFVLGGYQYLEYKGDAAPSKLKKVTVIVGGSRRRGARRGRAGARRSATRSRGRATW